MSSCDLQIYHGGVTTLPDPPLLPVPPTVSYCIWKPCNMRCKGCFATFHDLVPALPKGHLGPDHSLQVLDTLCARFEKVTLIGGEPTLCPWFEEAVTRIKQAKRTACVTTNGAQPEVLLRAAPQLDWVNLSIDSPHEATHVALGRAVRGVHPLSVEDYVCLAAKCRARGARIKVNTVVSRPCLRENFAPLIERIRPDRWKVYQVLPVAGQNDAHFEELRISDHEFADWCKRHVSLNPVCETNELMRGSYALVDPLGRFYDSSKGSHRYSQSVLRVGFDTAWREVACNAEKFRRRQGVYAWGNRSVADASD